MKDVLMPQINRLPGSMPGVERPDSGSGRIGGHLKKEPGGPQFDEILRGQLGNKPPGDVREGGEGILEPLRFSAHAQTRMQSRNIRLTPDQYMRMNEAVSKAAEKGINEHLVLTNDAAFIVSAKNRTIITAVDRNEVTGNLFTNIEGAVVI